MITKVLFSKWVSSLLNHAQHVALSPGRRDVPSKFRS